MKKLPGLQLVNELTFNEKIQPTAVHLITANSAIPKNLIVSGDKAGQLCIFEFGENDKPAVEIKPQSLIEITTIENLSEKAAVVSGKL